MIWGEDVARADRQGAGWQDEWAMPSEGVAVGYATGLSSFGSSLLRSLAGSRFNPIPRRRP